MLKKCYNCGTILIGVDSTIVATSEIVTSPALPIPDRMITMNTTPSHSLLHFFSRTLTICWALTLLASTAWACDACSQPSCTSCVKVRPGDTIWLLNTRNVYCDCDGNCSLDKLKVHRNVKCDTWRTSDLAGFLAEDDPSVNTVIWIHGNRVDSWTARNRGLAMYSSLTKQATDERPIRYVIWSWPSTQVRGLLNDVMSKAYRSDFEGQALAEVLAQINPETPVGLMGFSFGARIVTGAMHISAGGRLGRYQLAKRSAEPRKPYHAVLLAGALHDYWLQPNSYHGLAVSQTSHMLLLNNSCDWVLSRYHWIDRCSRPCALGSWGVASLHQLGDQKEKIKQHDVSYLIGSEHHGPSYIYSPKAMRMARQALIFD